MEVNIPSFSYRTIDKYDKSYEIYSLERRAAKNDNIFIDIHSVKMQKVEVQTEDIDIATRDPEILRVNEKDDLIGKFLEREIQQSRSRGHVED